MICVCVRLSSVCLHRLVNPYRTTRYVFQSPFETSAGDNGADERERPAGKRFVGTDV